MLKSSVLCFDCCRSSVREDVHLVSQRSPVFTSVHGISDALLRSRASSHATARLARHYSPSVGWVAECFIIDPPASDCGGLQVRLQTRGPRCHHGSGCGKVASSFRPASSACTRVIEHLAGTPWLLRYLVYHTPPPGLGHPSSATRRSVRRAHLQPGATVSARNSRTWLSAPLLQSRPRVPGRTRSR